MKCSQCEAKIQSSIEDGVFQAPLFWIRIKDKSESILNREIKISPDQIEVTEPSSIDPEWNKECSNCKHTVKVSPHYNPIDWINVPTYPKTVP